MATSDITSVGDAAAFLYGREPGEFVAARNQLVKELRAGGQRELAAEVATLRRPTVLAGELNRALRSSAVAVEAAIVAGVELRHGQQQALTPGGDDEIDVGALRSRHRMAAAEVAAKAQRDQAEVQAIVEAASLDESMHHQLRMAAFATAPTPQTGFDLLDTSSAGDATVTSLAEVRAARRRAAEPAPEPKPDPTTAPGDKAQRLAQRRVEAATRNVAKAQERVEAAEARLAAARGHLAEAESRLAEATAKLD